MTEGILLFLICFPKLEIVLEISSTKWNMSRRNNQHVLYLFLREVPNLQWLPAGKLSLL